MEKLRSILFVSLLLILSCNDDKKSSLTPSDDVDKTKIDDANVEAEDIQLGKMMYKFIRYHIGYEDPYSYLPVEQREKVKSYFEKQKSARVTALSGWQQAYETNKISPVAFNQVKTFQENLNSALDNGSFKSVEELDNWFVLQRDRTINKKDLNLEDKRQTLITQSIVRFALKAYSENLLPKNNDIKSDKSSRIQASCLVGYLKCAGSSIFTWMGYGKAVSTATGAGSATWVGAAVGVAIALSTCNCDSTVACTFAYALSTPDVCYNTSTGLKLKAIGYGANPSGFEFQLYAADNTAPGSIITRLSSSDEVTFTNAELAGYTTIYARVNTNCSGTILYGPTLVKFELAELGRPDYAISGPTTVHTSSNPYGYYEIIGRNGMSASMTAGAYYGTTPTGVSHSPGSGILTCTWSGTGSGWIKATVYDCSGSPVYRQLSVNVSN